MLFAVHTDTDHIHAHFLVSNCNQKDGTSFRRGPKELVEMSKCFGEQCVEYGLYNSVRDSFYSPDKEREEITFAEHQMKKRGKLSFKDEIKTYIRLVMNYESVKTVQDEELNVYGEYEFDINQIIDNPELDIEIVENVKKSDFFSDLVLTAYAAEVSYDKTKISVSKTPDFENNAIEIEIVITLKADESGLFGIHG